MEFPPLALVPGQRMGAEALVGFLLVEALEIQAQLLVQHSMALQEGLRPTDAILATFHCSIMVAPILLESARLLSDP